MVIDKRKRGFVRPIRKTHTEARQVAALRAAGVSVLYVVGKDGVSGWREFTSALRKGDTVYVEGLSLLAEPRSDAVRYPAMDLRDCLEEIERRGATWIETHTGRVSTDPVQRKAAIDDAARSLGMGRALPSDVAREHGKRGGRRPTVFSGADIAKAKIAWESRKHKTWKDVAKALPKGFSTARAHRMFGPRG
jgi:hypothetical protein